MTSMDSGNGPLGRAGGPHGGGRQAPDVLAPLLSALLFGYYGFLAGLDTHGSGGEPIHLWIAFVWVLRASAVLFTISTALALARKPATDLVYGFGGLLATAALAGVFVWDLIDPNSLAVSPILLLVFIVWNGYASLLTLREALR